MTLSKSAGPSEISWNLDDATIVQLTSATQLQARSRDPNNDDIAWQVVEFTTAGAATVQKGSTSFTSTQTSASVTLPTPSISRPASS